MDRRGILAAAAFVATCSVLGCDDVGDLSGGSPPPTKDAAIEAADASDGMDGSAATDASDARDVLVSDVVVSAAVPLASKSPNCLACAEASCGMYLHGCETIVGVASEGPARGTPEAELCVETLTCFLKTGCANYRVSNCYCLVDGDTLQMASLCHPPAEDKVGACKATLERSLETTDSFQILSRTGDLSKGGGWASILLQCLNDNHCTSCFRSGDAGPEDGEAAADARDATAD
jgi:hypothetical protein